MFRLIHNTLETEPGHSWQTCYFLVSTIFLTILNLWPTCKSLKIFQILSFPGKLEIERTMATLCWSSFARCVLLGSPPWPPACFTQHITCYPRRHLHWPLQLQGIKAKIQPLCASLFLVLTKILTTKILSYLRIVRQEIR